MANVKISNLVGATTINDSDILILENGTLTQKATVQQLKDKLNTELQSEVQRLTAAWEEQRKYIHGQEKTCADLWNQLQNSNQVLQKTQADLEEYKRTMNHLLDYLEEKKIIKLMTASGLLDIKQFRR
jgi:glucan phosphorylase